MNKEWRTIDSAPKTGESILVYPATWGGKNAAIARWDDNKYAKKPRPFWKRDDDFGRVSYSRQTPPTHWMPLPDPPSDDQK